MGCICGLFVTVLIMTLLLLSTAYDVKQQFQLAQCFPSQEFGKALLRQSISAPHASAGVARRAEGSTPGRLLHLTGRLVHSSSLGPQWRLPALAPWHVGLSARSCLGFLTAWWLGSKTECSQRPRKANGLLLTAETWKSHVAQFPLHSTGQITANH